MTKSIVVVHGVGSPELGSEIAKIADAIRDPDSLMRMSYIRSNKKDVPVGELTHKGETIRLYEMNWSHTFDTASSAKHTLGQVFRLVFATAQIAQAGWLDQTSENRNHVAGPSLVGLLYHWILVAITIWAPVLAATVIVTEILKDDYPLPAVLIAACVGVLVGLAAYLLRSVDSLAASLGCIWAAAITVIGVLVALGPLNREMLSDYVTKPLVLIGIYGSGVLAIIGVAQSFWRSKGARSSLRASSFRASMFVIPFIVLAAAWGPIVFTAQFMVVDQFISEPSSTFEKSVPLCQGTDPVCEETFIITASNEGLTSNEAKYVYDQVAYGLPYDLVTLEVINFASFCITISSLVVFFLIWHGLLGTNFVRSRDWGNQFRQLVAIWLILLILMGAITLVPAMIQSLDNLTSGAKGVSKFADTGMVRDLLNQFLPVDTSSALEVYRVSMWRIAAVLLFLMPMVATMVAIFSQIIFYIAPGWSPLSSREDLIAQFEDITELASSEDGGRPVVLAYSQGSKIASDAIARGVAEVKTLITIGSPVGPIHGAFLSMPIPTHEVNWYNFYRPSDFIGGVIDEPHVQNNPIDENFTSTHFKYYREKRVLAALGLD